MIGSNDSLSARFQIVIWTICAYCHLDPRAHIAKFWRVCLIFNVILTLTHYLKYFAIRSRIHWTVRFCHYHERGNWIGTAQYIEELANYCHQSTKKTTLPSCYSRWNCIFQMSYFIFIRPFEKRTYYAMAMSVRLSVHPSVRVFRNSFQHALRYQFETWYMH